jgi:acetyl-CoA carboxylase biotin carboxyl carrier protein
LEDVPEAAASPAVEEASAEEIDEEGIIPVVTSVTSVFYRKPSPEEPHFVEVGDAVEADTA